MKIVIVGAVAGGASAAARARRLDENAEIILFERGEAPSFANCGLPYYVGGVIEKRESLLVAPQERLAQRYRLDVRTRTEVKAIDRQQKLVRVQNLITNEDYEQAYDKLILSPGAKPLRPPIPGADLTKVFTLRDLQDADRLRAIVQNSKQAVVIGAGFIGLEMAENLVHRGLKTTVVELADQILPPWDAEMVAPLADYLQQQGLELRLSDAAEAITEQGESMLVNLRSGQQIEADLVIMSVGVRPENALAVDADLQIAQRGGIQVNQHMQTNDPDVYAVGDAVEVSHFVDGEPVQIPLGGPANRQGRIAADHIYQRNSEYRGTQGTAIVGIFDSVAAMTGYSEKVLKTTEQSYSKVYVHPKDHAGYYPGAKSLSMKVLFSTEDGKLLGAQVVGNSGVDKRIDVLAVAIQAGMTVYDLEEMELAYAPQFGSAKDPVNMAGFVAAGVLRGDHPMSYSEDLANDLGEAPFVLDVRSPAEFAAGHIPGAVNISIDELRNRLDEVPQDQPIVAYCQVGMRGYLATRLLMQKGFQVKNLAGGYTTFSAVTAGMSA